MAEDGVYEVAQLRIKPGEKESFAAAAGQACVIIAAAPGCRSAKVLDCIEKETEPIFLVHWDRLDDHAAFLESESLARCGALISPFFAEPPAPRHYTSPG